MDPNTYNFDSYGQETGEYTGDTNVLQAIQGNTKVLPAITADGIVGNEILESTAGLTGLADSNGYFGSSTDTNDIFGQTINTNTDTSEFAGTQTFGTTIQTNNYYGDNNYDQGNIIDTNPTYGNNNYTQEITNDNNTYYGAGTDTNEYLGTNQDIYEYGTTTQTYGTTDTNNYYGTTQEITGQNEYYGTTGETTNEGNIAYGTTQDYTGITNDPNVIYGNTQISTETTKTTFTTTGVPTNIQDYSQQNINYDTYNGTVEQINNIQPTYTNTEIPTTTNQINYQQNEVPTKINVPQITTTTTTINQTGNAGLITLPQPTINQNQNQLPAKTTGIALNNQSRLIFGPIKHSNNIKSNIQYLTTEDGKVMQTEYGYKILDEDFRRGRPIYNNTLSKMNQRLLQQKNDDNMPIRPSYNINLDNNDLLYKYSENNRITNSLALRKEANLDRIQKASSYDVYGGGITPLLNKVGLGTVNDININTKSKINDFI